MVRIKYVKKLEDLQGNVIKMGRSTMRSIDYITKALKTNDTDFAKKVITNDDEIDKLDKIIESQCMSLLALEQPMAGDLRVIATSLKMITDLERIGDFAEDIAEEMLVMDRPIRVTISEATFDEMIQKVKSMVADSIETYAQGDVERARMFESRDDEIDSLYKRIVNDFLTTIAEGSCPPEGVRDIASIIYIIRYLERIADHAVNIACRVLYMVEGERTYLR
jgi:phosphate transport system protein